MYSEQRRTIMKEINHSYVGEADQRKLMNEVTCLLTSSGEDTWNACV